MSNVMAVLVADGYVKHQGKVYSRGQEIPGVSDKTGRRLTASGTAHWEYREGAVNLLEAEAEMLKPADNQERNEGVPPKEDEASGETEEAGLDDAGGPMPAIDAAARVGRKKVRA